MLPWDQVNCCGITLGNTKAAPNASRQVGFGHRLSEFVLTYDAATDCRTSANVALTPYGDRDERVPIAVREEIVRSTDPLDTLR
jgi:hypothetical protein